MKLARASKLPLMVEKIRPETRLEQRLLLDPELQEGLFWGKPRRGHPEGEVLNHIEEVLQNVDQISYSDKFREALRLITILHDSFKYKEEQTRPRRNWAMHHAVLARQFAERYTQDALILDVIESHDDAYYAWCSLHYEQNPLKSSYWLNRLEQRLKGKEAWQLFYLFFKCDTCTGDKTLAPLRWFEEEIAFSRISYAPILATSHIA